MSFSLALSSSSSSHAHAARASGRALAGTSFLGSPRLSPPLQHGLLPLGSHRGRRGAVCSLAIGAIAWNGEGDEAKAHISRASRPAAAAAATSPHLGWGHSQGIVHSKGKARGDGVVCSASFVDFETLQWVSSIACLVLMLAKGAAIQKSFLAPLFALQAPLNVISWIKGEYGVWTAFLGLLVRLFYFIPGELDLPFLTMLLVIVSPHQPMHLRDSKAGAIISLVIAGYLAFQHFSGVGSLQKAFDQGSVVATVAVICIIIVQCLLLF